MLVKMERPKIETNRKYRITAINKLPKTKKPKKNTKQKLLWNWIRQKTKDMNGT